MASKKNLSLKEKYPEIYAQTNVDRTGLKRVVPMEVLSLGLGRTGTMCEYASCYFVVRSGSTATRAVSCRRTE